MKKSLTFFFPYHDVSGVPILFLNIAEYIASNYEYCVYIIDYCDGYMARSRKKNSKVKLIEFVDGNTIYISKTTLVMQAILPYAIRPELKINNNTKVFFWCLYPDIFFPLLFPFNFFSSYVKQNLNIYKSILQLFYRKTFNRIRKFVTEMSGFETLVFMDSSNLNRTNDILSLELKPNNFLPILCNSNVTEIKMSSPNGKVLNISWVGRICDFKVYILKYTIEKLAYIALNKRIHICFYVIGDGDKKYLIDNIQLNNEYFSLKQIGVIPKTSLDKYLMDNIDINVAMGTSALESAKLSIPTILLDISYKNVKGDYIFRWLHNTTNYDLGHNISQADFESDNKSLEKMLSEFMVNPQKLRDKSYQYFYNNHTLESISGKLIEFLELYSRRFEDIDKYYFKKNLLRKIYEYKRYKIWSQ